MKRCFRMLGLTLAAAFVLVVPVSHLLWGAPPAGSKRLICHFDDEGMGRVLEIAAQAIPAHCEHHTGDYTGGGTPPVVLVKGAACARITNPVCR